MNDSLSDKTVLSKIEDSRKEFERAVMYHYGLEVDVTVALHHGTESQTRAALEMGWQSFLLSGIDTLSTQSPTKPGTTGQTVIYQHVPDPDALAAQGELDADSMSAEAEEAAGQMVALGYAQ